MKKHLVMMALASGLIMATHASAMTREEHKAAQDRIEADYKSAKAQCDVLKNNAKDVCEKEAKGKENVAKAELEHTYKPSSSSARKVAEEKVKAEYEVAKEKCDDMKGDTKNACEKEAKAVEARGKSEVRAMK